jgi:hypothetical protein
VTTYLYEKRCTKCVLPDTTPNITFDQHGVCNYCTTYRKFEPSGERLLLNRLNAHRNKTKQFECIVNISGGRDSSFALLKIVKDYGMKALAVNYANPFTDNQAIANIRNMTELLNVPLHSFQHRSMIHESLLRNDILTWFRKPSAAMVPMMCIGCKIIWKHILQIARSNSISLIICGGNPYEYTSYKKESLSVSRDAGLSTYYIRYLRGLARESLKNLAYIKPRYVPTLLKGYLYSQQYAIGPRIFSRDIEILDLFHFIQWNEQEIISRITGELEWDYPHDLKSTWRFDCRIAHLKDYMYMKTLGMTEKDDFYAKMVREGLMSRQEALRRLENENQIHMEIIAELLEQQGLSPKYFLT